MGEDNKGLYQPADYVWNTKVELDYCVARIRKNMFIPNSIELTTTNTLGDDTNIELSKDDIISMAELLGMVVS